MKAVIEGGYYVDSFYRPTWVEISLDAISHNLDAFRRVLPQDMKIMAIVKANAYGHGAVPIARKLVSCGADYLGVAFLDEALELRHAGIESPILVLGYTAKEGLALAVEHNITLTVYDDEILLELAKIADERGLTTSQSTMSPIKIHVKIDTGMGRIGLYEEKSAIEFLEKTLQIDGILVEGVFTHYACADEADPTYTLEQHRKFDRIIEHFRSRGIEFPFIHAGNSATGLHFPHLTYNMVRLGISLYGIYPDKEVNRLQTNLQPVMSYKTKVVMVKTLPAGSGISYGATYTTKGEESIATLPIGYADGYTRSLSGMAQVLIHGRKVPVVGRICMDQCMINVTGLDQVRIGDEVVLFGAQGNEELSTDQLADWLGTISYEIICMVSNRVPRVYLENGQIVSIVNNLGHYHV